MAPRVDLETSVALTVASAPLKQARSRGFRQFLLRGFENVRAEWAIVCTFTTFSSLLNGGVRSPVASGLGG